MREAGLPNVHTLAYKMLPTVYVQNASIYITRPRSIREKHSPTGDTIIPFVMNEVESLDLKTPLDFTLAELLVSSGVRAGEPLRARLLDGSADPSPSPD